MGKRKLCVLLITVTLIAATMMVAAPTATLDTATLNTNRVEVDLTPARNPTPTPPQAAWNKTYGGTNWDEAHSAQQTVDGGYVVAGTTASFGAGSGDFWLVKADSAGNQQWNKTYGGTTGDGAYSVQQTSDGGYVLAGYTMSFGAIGIDFWLVKADSAGNQQWNKTYGGASEEVAYSVQQTSDGGYVVAGTTTSFGAGSGDFWLVRVDSSGNQQWNKTYGGASEEVAYSVQQTSDGGYVVAGTTTSFGAGSGDFWLVKTDSAGNQQWNKTYGGTSIDAAHSVQQISDGGYILAGETDCFGAGSGDFWLVRVDSSGNQQWNKTYGGTSNDYACSIRQTFDGGYIMAGATESFGAGSCDLWLVKTDSAGNQQWNKTYGGARSDYAYSVRQTSDGGYIMAGITTSFGAALGDFWLVKTPEDAIPPSTITDLVAGTPTSNSVTLNWAAPGDEWNMGNVTGYVVKYSTTGQITDENWGSATTYAQSWNPLPAGTQETRVISGLNSSTLYWFAIKAYDEVPNYSACSNSPHATTTTTAQGIPLIIIVSGVAVAAIVAVISIVIITKRKK